MKCYSQTCKFVFREADKLNDAAQSDNEFPVKVKPTEVKNRRRAKSFATSKYENASHHKRNASAHYNNFNTVSRVQS